MTQFWLVVIDLVAISVLTLLVYLPRHRRPEMVALLVGLNVGVMAVSIALTSTEVSAGLGLGLFGVLSIVRTRSDTLSLEQIAYCFSALALGLLSGFEVDPVWVGPALMGLVIVALLVADHPGLVPDDRRLSLTLDRAYSNDLELRAHVERFVGPLIDEIVVRNVDLVDDKTSVDVRYRIDRSDLADGEAPRPGLAGQRASRRSIVTRRKMTGSRAT